MTSIARAHARHLGRAVVVGAAVIVAGGGAGVARADPPTPTDYRSEVVSITPDVDGVEVRVVGGDSFVELVADSGIEVIVEGYSGEPYLRFDPAGGVDENQRSPARFMNDDRFAATEIPAEADPSAEPEWRRVTDGHRWAWHDHRTHWMAPQPPLGLSPGDQVSDGVVPLSVDGVDVDVRVVSTWVAPPARWPSIALALAAGAVGAALVVRGVRRGRLVAVVSASLVVLSALALVVGVWQTVSLPSATGPPITAWVLPLTALVAAGAASVSCRAGRPATFTTAVLATIGGVQLAVWFVLRRLVITRPVLTTSAPFWFDRSITVFVGVATAVLVCATVAHLTWPPPTREVQRR